MKDLRIFYVYGMGGGTDSRIPSVLAEHYAQHSYVDARGDACQVKVMVQTYGFDPEIAAAQILEWAKEFKPDLVIGESLGANHAIKILGVPHLYVSPAMAAPRIMAKSSFLAYIPGMTAFLNKFFRPSRPGRQAMDFRPSVMRKYGALAASALQNARKDYSFAFFGTMDHYRKWGVVRPGQWARCFGDYKEYPGSHFMEMEFLDTMLIPKINELLSISSR